MKIMRNIIIILHGVQYQKRPKRALKKSLLIVPFSLILNVYM